MVLVVVVLRTNLRRHEHLPQNQHWHFSASNCCAESAPYHPLGFTHFDPGLQCLLLFHLHLPMLANILLLGAVPGRKGQVHSISHRRQFVLRILRVELCHGLDVQYCPNLHHSRLANEPTEEDYSSIHSRILRCVSHSATWSTCSHTDSFTAAPLPQSSAFLSSTASMTFRTSFTPQPTSPSGRHARPVLVSPHLPSRRYDLSCARSLASSSHHTATQIGRTRESGLEHTPVDRATSPTQARAVTTTSHSQDVTKTSHTSMSSPAATQVPPKAPSV
jgi:hypothetical protein